MPNQALLSLQATINRFTDAGGFSPIVIDGGMGSETENATQNALVAACTKTGDPADRTNMICNLMDQMNTAFAAGGGQSWIMGNVQTLTSELNTAGNALFLPAAATVTLKPNVVPSIVPNKTQVTVKPPPSATSIDKARLWFRQAPLWQQVGIGVAGGLALLFGFNSYKKSKRA